MSPLARSVAADVLAVQAARAAQWIPDEDVEDWPVSEEETSLVDLDDTRPFTREELERAERAHRCPTLRSFPAPQRAR